MTDVKSDRSGPPGRPVRRTRAEQQAITRAALVAAAADAYAEQGVAASSIEDICTRAGYSRGAFYSNFEDKDDLLLAVLEAEEHRDVAEITGFFADDPDPATLIARLRARGAERSETSLFAHRLHTELRVHALRHDGPRERLADFDRRQRANYRNAIDALLQRTGSTPPADLDLLALIAQSVVDGIAIRRQLDATLPPPVDLDAIALLMAALLALAEPSAPGEPSPGSDNLSGRSVVLSGDERDPHDHHPGGTAG